MLRLVKTSIVRRQTLASSVSESHASRGLNVLFITSENTENPSGLFVVVD